MIYLWILLFALLLVSFWAINFFGLPGNWLIVLAAVAWMFLGPEEYRFGWIVPVSLVALGLVGEALEFLASVLGTRQLGGSNRGATCSVIGSIAGGIAGIFFGIPIPIPIVGSLVGAILFAGIGAWIGATIGEQWEGKSVKESIQIGGAAFLGRIMGTIGKVVVGLGMVVFTLLSLFL